MGAGSFTRITLIRGITAGTGMEAIGGDATIGALMRIATA
jgi:hypothetical protein